MKKLFFGVVLSFFVAISISPYLQAEETETKNIKTDTCFLEIFTIIVRKIQKIYLHFRSIHFVI